uniref:Leucine-rich repeats and calponin homology (CH) domain containing 1 n=1 Tax=Callorhinchus milii TaxID=7868 RepID=A0A4W3IIC9_CALMI
MMAAPVSRSVERAVEEAAASGSLSLSGRKLKELPRSAAALELSDTVQADLSKNRLSEIPVELCQFVSLEMLNLYHNCIRVIPDMVINLQMLTYLNLSRNQLSLLPPCLCALPLKVLIASNNKLVSLPENIGQLKCLMELDVSCNEITTLPQHIGQLQSLRELNIRRNYLHILPEELAELPLMKLDFSCNKVVSIPICFRNMRHLQIIELDNNPLQSPPAQICIKGKVHIFKYLNIEACRIDKTAESPYQHIEDIYPDKKQDPDSGIGSDNGDKRLSATEPSDEDTGSLTIQMANISEEDQFHKQEDYLNIRSKQGKLYPVYPLGVSRHTSDFFLGLPDQLSLLLLKRQILLFSTVFIRPTRHFESVDPQFTIRRKMEQMREEREHIEQLRENIETRLKVDLPEETGAALMDGVVLCHLVNHIRPRSVVSIHVPSPAVPKLSMAKCRRNVENFLEACRKMGVPEADLCSPYDILQSDVCGIQKTVGALLAHGENVQQSTHAILTWDLFGFCLFHTFFLMLLYITYNWSALM